MKIAISNIGWTPENDSEMYEILRRMHIDGLEIAPTRIIPERPYEKINEAVKFASKIKKDYGLEIPSIQSIWYGKPENIWESEEARKELLDYTKKAIDFAALINCKNLVFGCPRNRAIPQGADKKIGVRFFKELGDYAAEKNTCIGMEANPIIYNTNYINTTSEAISLIEEVNSTGFRLNLDIGTVIQNEESLNTILGHEDLINHVHISEPGLCAIKKRGIHKELVKILNDSAYKNTVSIEMSKQDDLGLIINIIEYVKELFTN